MARRLRMLGTTSKDGKCPSLYEDLDTGEVLVQGKKVTEPEDIAQLKDVAPHETFVIVPRELLTRFAPKE
ncbi:hypothetical protein [Streptomyces caatingaensis]|uniref:Uncharacterized protein n=1 Tax=Streptomyces caatingaensis TaxID=1678637 RepID=A0A0K9XE52_9ACTN|nr:hypothetical protein [Streptomyces caatingaensis]KNB51513.1 hypothetical protein AC230_14095 [Streptomyces caatingaensis]